MNCIMERFHKKLLEMLLRIGLRSGLFYWQVYQIISSAHLLARSRKENQSSRFRSISNDSRSDKTLYKGTFTYCGLLFFLEPINTKLWINKMSFSWYTIQAFLGFRGFNFHNFRFKAVYNSILFSSHLLECVTKRSKLQNCHFTTIIA